MNLHSTHLAGRVGAAGIVLSLFTAAAQAQDAPPQQPSTEAAREALGKKEGDVDQAKLLKETLTAADKQYSLLKRGKVALTYDLSYAYIGQQTIEANFTDDKLTLFDIQNTRSHTITNTVSADYGVLDNLTANVTLPLVSKYSQSEKFSGLSNAIGDVSLGARYQPFALSREAPSFTVTGNVRLPSGRSPFKTIDGQGLATGAGYTSFTLGVNASKVVDPVALFGSLNMSLALPAKHLNQQRSGLALVEVKPGPSIGLGIGFAYALSYNISTTLSFQEAISARSKLILEDSTGVRSEKKTSMQTSGALNVGLGVRVSPQTTLNFTVGVGMTSDTPDFTLGLNLPLHF
jgi:hypothetical protein